MTSILDDSDLTQDAFLGGRLKIWQPRKGYRAGIDPVLLAAAVTGTPGQSALELGCGTGVAALCLQHRVGKLDLHGLELQPAYAALAARNAAENSLSLTVIEGSLQSMPAGLRALSFDHVFANPPYYNRQDGTGATDAGREISLGEGTALVEWVDAAVRRLKPKGIVTMIQRADRLADLLAACDKRIGDLRVLPISPRLSRAAERVILRGCKGARGPLRLLAPLVLHEGSRHLADGDSFRPDISAVLRRGASLPVDWGQNGSR